MTFDAFTSVLDYPMYLVTTSAAGQRAGCLVGFASQCSIDPPRFVVWLSKENRTYRLALAATHLGVHALRKQDRELAALFGSVSGDETDKFKQIAWQPKAADIPMVMDVGAWFVGRIAGRFDGGDHTGFLLEPVETASPPAQASPPLFFKEVDDLSPGHPA